MTKSASLGSSSSGEPQSLPSPRRETKRRYFLKLQASGCSWIEPKLPGRTRRSSRCTRAPISLASRTGVRRFLDNPVPSRSLAWPAKHKHSSLHPFCHFGTHFAVGFDLCPRIALPSPVPVSLNTVPWVPSATLLGQSPRGSVRSPALEAPPCGWMANVCSVLYRAAVPGEWHHPTSDADTESGRRVLVKRPLSAERLK
jgi:hypothetical protein